MLFVDGVLFNAVDGGSLRIDDDSRALEELPPCVGKALESARHGQASNTSSASP
ncbi:Uncharacterised protein [Bordetella pertussis]|nr:Uncharacterised protein [Bordetella pertussis]